MIPGASNLGDGMDAFLAVVRALSEPNRVRVVKLLQLTSLSAGELAEILDRPLEGVLGDLAPLEEAGLVKSLDEESERVFCIHPGRSNLYGAVLLALLDGWLNEDPDVRGDLQRVERFLGRRP